MTGVLTFTILGCGSSGGVPRADGNWGACDPTEPKNRRSRCSLLVRRDGAAAGDPRTTVLVDTAPDLRLQTAMAGAKRLDGVLFTHDHADQTHGLDDIRAFAQRDGRRIPCWADAQPARTLRERFRYVFEGEGLYPPIAELRPLPPRDRAFGVDGPSGAVPVTSFDVDHGGPDTVGYRFGDVGYCSDVVRLPDAAKAALHGLDVLVVDALRYRPHPTHAHLDLALAWIAELRPRRAILTNMHIDLDYATVSASLPPGVEAAYDGLSFRSEVA